MTSPRCLQILSGVFSGQLSPWQTTMPYWQVLLCLGAAVHTARTRQSSIPFAQSVFAPPSALCVCSCVYLITWPGTSQWLSSMLCHYLGRFGEAHGTRWRTRRPRPRGSRCHVGRRQSWCGREVRGVRLQRSAQRPHLPGQEHPRLQAQKVRVHSLFNRSSAPVVPLGMLV